MLLQVQLWPYLFRENRRRLKYLGWLFIGMFFFISCKNDKRPNIEISKDKIVVPAFDKEKAYEFLEAQVKFGPRVPNSKAHSECANYLLETLSSFGLNASIETFTAQRHDGLDLYGKNIIGTINPESSHRIFLCAHWDTRYMADHDAENREKPILGADDGASGVAVLLEVARVLSQAKDITMGVSFVFFDLEDQGADNGTVGSWGLGSQEWAKKHKDDPIQPKFGILLDMVGSRGALFKKEKHSMDLAPGLTNKIWALANKLGYGSEFINEVGRGVLDDHYFVMKEGGWPCVDIIHSNAPTKTGFGKHWHTHDDNLDIIDKNKLRTVGNVVLNVVYREDVGKF